MTTVTVAELWRFPVKSMGGDRVDELRVDARGAHADRLWALRDVETGGTVSARRAPKLLGCSARYEQDPADDAGPGNVPSVLVTFPDGSESSSGDADVHERLSELVGREVRLTALRPVEDVSEHRQSLRQAMSDYAVAQRRRDFGLAESEPMPDMSVFTPKQLMTLARYSTPPGAFVDLSPIHLLSTTSMRSLSADGSGYDVRRFRPNMLVDIDDAAAEYPEAQWVGGELTIGKAALRVTIPTVRCSVPSRPQPGIEVDRQVGRQLTNRTGRFLGVYADVSRAGVLRVGDTVEVREPAAPGAVVRTAAQVGKRVAKSGQWVLEKTVMRGS